MKKLIIALAVLALFAGTAWASLELSRPTSELRGPNRANTLFYYENHDGGGTGGWTTADLTLGAAPKFHVDTYYSFDTNSWWCGELNPDFAGGDGYANSWDMRLNVPPTAQSGGYDILTFAGRFDSEPAYDFTFVQAKSGGAYIDLNPGYDGSSAGWFDLATYGFPLIYDAPHEARFRFISDGAWSDGDGLYDSDAGAFGCDNVKIFDYNTGTVLFLDDVESGGLCTPSVPGAAGDWWHIVVDLCSSASPPNSWWCGDDADSNLIPPNLQNELKSPVIPVTNAVTCTVRNYNHAGVPTVDNDYWVEAVSLDGGVVFYDLHAWWGDFEGCAGWGTSGINGDDVTAFLVDGDQLVYKKTFYTTDNGCGPALNQGAGINFDDVWVEGEVEIVPVEDKSWSRVKSMYR